MAIAPQGTPSLYENASNTQVVVPYPSGIVAGELLVMSVSNSNATISTTPPTGFTLVAGQNGPTTSPSTVVFYRIADATESGSVTFATGTAGRVTGVIARWSGNDSTTPLDVTAVSANSTVATTFTMPSITTVTNNAVLVHTISLNAASAADIVTLAGTTLLVDTTGTGRRQGVYYETLATAGASGTRTWSDTPATSLQWAGVTLAIRPSSGGAQTQSFTDAEGLTDSLGATNDAARGVDDPEGITDVLAAVNAAVRSQTDPVGLTDSLGGVNAAVRSPADPLGWSEALTVIWDRVVSVLDPLGITDNATSGGVNATVADALGLSDSLGTVADMVRTVTDSLGLTDALTTAAAAARSQADPFGLTDTATDTNDAARAGTDMAGLTDSLAAAFGMARTSADPLGITDALSVTWNRAVTVADALGFADLLISSGAGFRDLTLAWSALMGRLFVAGQVARFNIVLPSRFAAAQPAARFVLAGLSRFMTAPLGGAMTMTIHVSKGEKQYAGATITETTGKDISGATYLVSLGTSTVPGTGATPDRNAAGATPNVRTVAKLIDNTVPLGTYWVWVHVGDSPENVLLPVVQIVVA